MRTFYINLERRADRRRSFVAQYPNTFPMPSPFGKLYPFQAIDGEKCQPPDFWQVGAGAWGCYRSHLTLLEHCLSESINEVLVLEDDAVFVDDFFSRSQDLLLNLPADWHMLYLGGQLLNANSYPPKKINSYVYKPFNVNRTHAYALRGPMISALYRHLCRRDWMGEHHIDHHYGRLCETGLWNIYCPAKWLVHQAASPSDILVSEREVTEMRWPDPNTYDIEYRGVCLDFSSKPSKMQRLLEDIGANVEVLRNPSISLNHAMTPRVISVDGSIEDALSILRYRPAYMDVDSSEIIPECIDNLILRLCRFLSIHPSYEKVQQAKENSRPSLTGS